MVLTLGDPMDVPLFALASILISLAAALVALMAARPLALLFQSRLRPVKLYSDRRLASLAFCLRVSRPIRSDRLALRIVRQHKRGRWSGRLLLIQSTSLYRLPIAKMI
jgi:hypothetical protein